MEIVDAVGGIDVVLPQDFTMPVYSKNKGLVLRAGKQHLDGEMVHAITTYRASAADEFSRLARQNVIIEGMRKKLLDPSIYMKIPELYSIYKNDIITDLSLEQIAALSCLTRLVPPENVTVETPDIEQIIVKQDGSMYMKDSALLVKEIQTLFEVP
jgi:anionic cell wall polymer biosynthesis LytR-Cps2A-Psr (LCP) family protein